MGRALAPAAGRGAGGAGRPPGCHAGGEPGRHPAQPPGGGGTRRGDEEPGFRALRRTARSFVATHEDRPEFARYAEPPGPDGDLPDFLRDLSRRPRLLRGTAGAARIIGRPPGLAAGQGSILFCHIECGPIIPMGKAAAWQESMTDGGKPARGCQLLRRAAAEVDASFLDVNEYAPAPRRGPAVSTISAREEADSNLRWARVQRREKLRGPVTITETLSLGLGAAALAAYASHGIPRRDRYDTVDFNSPASDDKAAVSDARPAAPGDSGAPRRKPAPPKRRPRPARRPKPAKPSAAAGSAGAGRRAARPSSPPPSCGPRARPMAWPGARLRPVPAHSPPA